MHLGIIAMIVAAGSLAAAEFTYPPAVDLATIQARLAQTTAEHPRLLASGAELAALRTTALPPQAAELAAGVIRDAKAMLAVAPITRKQEGRRLLGQSRRCLKRCLTLAMAYHLTGDDAYAKRGQEEMLAVAGFSDWNPSHYLDVAEMTLGMAIGYDWLYHQLDPAARAAIRDAILAKGVRVPWENPKYAGWSKAGNNWGQVCHAGMVAGALVTREDDPELAAKTVERALRDVTVSLRAFAPKGSYPEGPGYWNYGTSFNVVLVASLESVFGTSFGLDLAPGFATTAEYVPLVYGPSGQSFNYADGGAGRGPQEVLHWFAKRYDRPDWLLHEDEILAAYLPRMGSARSAESDGERLLPLALLWMQASPAQMDIRLPLNWQSEGHVPITLHRSSWTDPNASFVGIKAGSPSASHGHMDIGSFVFDADGLRWAIDLGAESYHGIESRGMNLWSSAQDSDRWKIFRLNNTSHNTLVIDGALQYVKGQAKIVGFSDQGDFPHTVVDMSDVYRNQVKTAFRGVAMLASGEVLIQDHLTGGKPGTKVRWGFLTKGKPESLAAPAVTLLSGKKSLRVTRLTPEETVWQAFESARPPQEWDTPNPNSCILGFEAVFPESGELKLAVLLTPGSRSAESLVETLVLRQPENW